MEEQISVMLIEILAAATCYNVACTTAATMFRKGIIGSYVSLYINQSVVVVTLNFMEVH